MVCAPLSIAGSWRVQVMAVQDLTLAEQLEEQMRRVGHKYVGIHWRDASYKIWVGAEETQTDALELQVKLVQQGFEDAFVIQAGPDRSGYGQDALVIAEKRYVIQVFSLSNRTAAERAADAAQKGSGYDASVIAGDGLFRVQLGPFESHDAAEFAKQVIVGRGYADAFLVPFEE